MSKRKIHREPAADADADGLPELQALVDAVKRHAQDTFGQAVPAGLYLVATPIGNLSDITLRALHVLLKADVIYCEDTRLSRTLLEHYQIKSPLKTYHEHNAAKQRPVILKALTQGARVALISDAGTPLISDPGFKIVRDACEAGHAVFPVPGASAVLAGLTVSALPTDNFHFVGFLPAKPVARRKRLAALANSSATLVFFEAANRIAEVLADVRAELGDRNACIARELTKLHEDVRRGRLSTLIEELTAAPVKGECVIVIGAAELQDVSDQDIVARLERLLPGHSVKDAARAVADELNVAKGRVYDIALAVKRRQSKT